MGNARFDMRNPTCEIRHAACEMGDGQGQGSEEAGWREGEGVKPPATPRPLPGRWMGLRPQIGPICDNQKGRQARRHVANIELVRFLLLEVGKAS